ncbi:MAG: hypothetical protein D3922_00360 [Candidatus Electrothrix sp. AR1]|nr:hypothetical protein [Candidatus Electrothrix sp. AR1]
MLLCPAELRVLLFMSGRSCSVECTKKKQTDKANQSEKQQGVQIDFFLHHSFRYQKYTLFTRYIGPQDEQLLQLFMPL